MSSVQTSRILYGVRDRLNTVVNNAHYKPDEVRKILAVCGLQYRTWRESVELEAGSRAQYAFNDLPDDEREVEEQVKWHFTLLEAYVGGQKEVAPK